MHCGVRTDYRIQSFLVHCVKSPFFVHVHIHCLLRLGRHNSKPSFASSVSPIDSKTCLILAQAIAQNLSRSREYLEDLFLGTFYEFQFRAISSASS